MEHKVGLQELLVVLNKPLKWPDKDWLLTVLAKIPGRSCPIW